jgi:rhombotail lipoprotein
MRRTFSFLMAVTAAAAFFLSCATGTQQHRASSLEFLYPKGAPGSPPSDVMLQIPVRIGIAFPPSNGHSGATFDEVQKRDLLERVAAAFRGRSEIARVDVIPSLDLRKDGGFENLDQLATMYGLDLFALVSYEQVQFSEETAASITYWTVVGAYVIKGDRNETRTVMDASIFDLKSRALLFRASGQSQVERSSTAIDVQRSLREASRQGFEQATTNLIADLEKALVAFREQAKTGTVRGQGTPAIEISSARGAGGGGTGAGAAGPLELVLGLMVVGGAWLHSARRRRS